MTVPAPDFDLLRLALAAKFIDSPQWADLEAILDWIADKPGYEFGLAHVAEVLGIDEIDPGATSRLVAAVTPLTRGREQAIASPFTKIRSPSTGDLHAVNDFDIGFLTKNPDAPYYLAATGETISRPGAHAFVYFRSADFRPAPVPAPGKRG
jgi:hypothetical protein